jgi:tetratricopeptide (TPR) repeat protein
LLCREKLRQNKDVANTNVNSEFVERYQMELDRDPRSRVFAPLAEAYRKMGLLDEAKRICRFGTEAHPDFAGGHVAYAKVLLDLKAPAEALSHLEKATKLSPDNLLAHNLLGETLIQLRRPKDALKAFKMVLFLDPENARAKQAVKKWEFLTADEYPDEVFAMKPIFEAPLKPDEAERDLDDELEDLLTEDDSAAGRDARLDLQQRHARALERAVSLADAFTVRNDLEAALKVLEDARRLLGPMDDIERRHKIITKRLDVLDTSDDADDGVEDDSLVASAASASGESLHELPFEPIELRPERKREILETLLRRINTRRPSSVG